MHSSSVPSGCPACRNWSGDQAGPHTGRLGTDARDSPVPAVCFRQPEPLPLPDSARALHRAPKLLGTGPRRRSQVRRHPGHTVHPRQLQRHGHLVTHPDGRRPQGRRVAQRLARLLVRHASTRSRFAPVHSWFLPLLHRGVLLLRLFL